ncbi:adenylate/guanylate cyclase domain-containing protein [Desulfosarcina sp.]|uniref:adenylate/guanylate cyclase domain-containing protein n=1 Tax=Desulfosarcina sp. TaxID=2027861 RepID=UPI003565478E
MNLNVIKTGIIIFLLAAVAVVHHLPIHGFLGTHILHRELFFFPIVLAGLWFGLPAALVTSAAASIVYAHFFYHNIDAGRISVAVVGLQVAGFNLMALLTGWMVDRQRRQQRERDFLNETFGRYVSKAVRDEILGGRVTLSGELKEVTVLFADLRDFTRLVETLPPREVVTVINTYFKSMSEAINAHHGLVLQFIGDEIEAVFGAPVALENHQQCAVDAALDMRTRLSQVNLQLVNQGFPSLRHGIGLHAGKVVAANIGSSQRLSYALVGETVNIASRIQELNKDFDTDILISDAVRQGLHRSIQMNPLSPVPVKGVGEPLQLHSIDEQPFVCVT